MDLFDREPTENKWRRRSQVGFAPDHPITFEGTARRVFSKDDLVKKAKARAAWSQFGIALLGDLAAGAAASQ